MYLGRLVEVAPSDELYDNPLHPYTKALLSSIPIPDPKAARASQRVALAGELPSPLHVPEGCRFHTRCPLCTSGRCDRACPELREVTPNHFVACSAI